MTRYLHDANLPPGLSGQTPYEQTPSGEIDGSNTVFLLSLAPTFCLLFLNGLLQRAGDYTRVGETLNFVADATPAEGDSLTAIIWE